MANYRPTHLPGQMQQLPGELAREVSPSEQLLWWGRPLAGMRLRGSDAVGIPFSLMWGGFAIFWETMAIRSGAPFFFKLWGIPFVAVGLYLIAGRFLYDAWRRSRTAYAVTNERVILLSGGVRPSVLSLRLRTIPAVSLTEGRGGVGTISFGGGATHLGGVVAPAKVVPRREGGANPVTPALHRPRRAARKPWVSAAWATSPPGQRRS
jgi:hypothetical protein